MTIEEAKAKWLTVVKGEIGYHEYGTNGTKYATDYDWDSKMYGFDMQGLAWCDWFADWTYCKAFGFDIGCKMIYQDGTTGGAACMNSAGFYRNNGAWYSKPEVGDQVIYSGENHTGVVIAVNSNGSFDAVDGNYSDAVTLRQGLWPSCASGFGRPNWSLAANGEAEESKEETADDESSETFAAGDIVSIKSGATYYNGGTIPSKYLAHKWIIMQVFNDRAVLNKSADGEISGWMSPVNTAYLTKENSSSSESSDSSATTDTSADATATTSASTSTSSTAWGIVSAMAEKIINNSSNNSTVVGPVILNNTATPTHTYGGKFTVSEGK